MNWRDSIWASDNRSYLGVPTAVSYAALSYLWKRTHYTWITKASKFTTAFSNSPSWLNLRWEQKFLSQSAGGSASAMMIKHHFKHTAATDEWVFNEGQQWGVASQTHSTLGGGGGVEKRWECITWHVTHAAQNGPDFGFEGLLSLFEPLVHQVNHVIRSDVSSGRKRGGQARTKTRTEQGYCARENVNQHDCCNIRTINKYMP